jgi:hypothetical protein
VPEGIRDMREEAMFLEDENQLHQVAAEAIADIETMNPKHVPESVLRAILFLHGASHCSRQGCKMRATNALQHFKNRVFAYSVPPGAVPEIEFLEDRGENDFTRRL